MADWKDVGECSVSKAAQLFEAHGCKVVKRTPDGPVSWDVSNLDLDEGELEVLLLQLSKEREG